MFHTVSINLYIHISTLRTPYTRTKAYLAILLLSKTKFSIVLNSLPPVPQRRCCHMASHGYMLTCIVRSTLYMLYALTSNLRKAALHIRTINLRRQKVAAILSTIQVGYRGLIDTKTYNIIQPFFSLTSTRKPSLAMQMIKAII